MSQVVDTKVVEMQFDNSKFEKNIETSLNSLKFLNKSIEDAGKNRNSLDELAKAGDHVGVSFDNMNMKSRISLSLMDMLAGVGTKAFNRISDAVAGFALNMANSLSGMQAMRDGFNEYELKMGSVQTILAGAKIKNPLWSKETAKEQKKWVKDTDTRLEIVNQKLEELNAYSDKTIYSFKDMTSNIGKFTNAGVDLDTSVKAIQGVANVAAVSGANANEASRAMYNFAQALSSGAVKLIDWKSIENANMATVEFKQQLLNTAVALGTVKKEGKDYVALTKNAAGKTSDERFSATKKFNDLLSQQWMTTKVLTQTLKNYSTDVREMNDEEKEAYQLQLKKFGYTDKQIEQIMELGSKAFDAATEVKTFSQMIDTLKESLGSGWAQTWEIVFGDFNEAKALWTSLNNTIDGILSPIGKVRNEILKLWKEDGGRDATIQGFKNLFEAVKGMLAPLKELWAAFTPTKSNAGKILVSISKQFEKFTAWLITISPKVAKVLRVALKPLIAIGKWLSKYIPKMVSIVKGAWTKISGYLTAFGKTIANIFGKHITSRIKAFRDTISKTFADIKKRLKESTTIQNIIKAFNDLRLVVQDLFWRVVSHATTYANHFAIYLGKIWKALSPLVSSAVTSVLKSLSNVVLPKLRKAIEWVTDKIRDLGNLFKKINIRNTGFYKGLVELPEKIKGLSDNKTLKSIFTWIKDFGSGAVTFLSDKFASLKANVEAIKMPNGLKDLFDNIRNFIGGIFGKESVDNTLTKTVGEAAAATDGVASEDSGKKLTAFQGFLEGVSGAFEWLKTAAGKARDAIADFIGFIRDNTPKALKAFHDFIAGDDGLITMSDITDVIYTVSDAFSMLMTSWGFVNIGSAAKGISASFGDLAESIVNLSKRAGNKFNMSALKDFAIAVGILVGALWVLSKIPADKLVTVAAVLLTLGAALSKFFSMISSGKANIHDTAGFIPIAILLIAMSGAMLAVAASLGILVGVLAIFPSVIKKYNNLGEAFRKGMDRVKEVLVEIFEYLDHAASSKYSFRSAMALLGLVFALKMLAKTIEKYASADMAEAMEDGLNRISQVLGILGSFLSGIQLGSFSFINIGIDFDTVGMAAMIFALGFMIKKIAPVVQDMAKLTPSEFETAFDGLKKIFTYLGVFLASLGAMAFFTDTGLGKWLGMAATVTLIASAISSCVSSIKTMAGLATGNKEGFKAAMTALSEIFFMLGGVLAVIGLVTHDKGALLNIFGLTLAIGALTACVVALYPLAQAHPDALQSAVISVGGLMVALGATLFLVGKATEHATVKDIFQLIVMSLAMVQLAQAIRRISKTGGDPGSIVAAGAAIAAAAISMGLAIRIMNGVKINWTILVALGLITAAIWGVVFAIRAFKGSSGEAVEGANKVKEGVESMGEGANEALGDLSMNLDISGLLENLGSKIGEKLGNLDLGGFIRNAITTVKKDAKNWAQDFIDVGTNLVDGISTAISNPANVEKIKESIKALGQALLDSFKLFFGINSPSTVMAEQGGFILDGLVQGLMEFPSKLAGWVEGIGTYIKEGVKGLVENAGKKGKEFVDGVGQGIQNGKEAVKKKASALGKAALDKVGKAKDWAGKALQSANSYGAKLKASKNPIKKAAGAMITGATSSVQKTASIFRKASSDASSKFSSQLNAGKGPARAAGAAIVTGAKSAFNGITSSFLAFGKNAAEGFRNGINSLIATVAAKAREMVRKAKEAAKSEQNSNSPSKDFMEFGGWAAQGYALGLVNRKDTRRIAVNARKMVGAAKDAASSTNIGTGSLYLDSNPAMSSLAYAMSQISDTLDENMNTSPTIRPVIDMSNVNHGASAIAALFGDKPIDASVDILGNAQKDFNQAMSNKTNAYSSKSIDKLAGKIDDMTRMMNSRSLNNYITVDGATDPTAFADELIRSFRLNARTV